MYAYPQKKHNRKQKGSLPKCTVVHVYIPPTKNNINTKVCCQKSQSYMCTYPLQQQKHKQKGSLPKCTVLHLYILSTTTQT